jgi:hypothetical protein
MPVGGGITYAIIGATNEEGTVLGSLEIKVLAQNGLVGWWQFEDPSGTTTVLDSSGSGNNGTLINGAVETAGVVNGAVQLNGTTQYVQIPDTGSSCNLDVSPEWAGITLAAWIYPTTANSAGIVGKTYQYQLDRHANGSITYSDSITPNTASIGYYGNTPINTWSHVAVTFDGSNICFYINGVLVETLARAGSLSSDTFDATVLGGGYFGGNLDDVRIYNRALSSTEVETLAAP